MGHPVHAHALVQRRAGEGLVDAFEIVIAEEFRRPRASGGASRLGCDAGEGLPAAAAIGDTGFMPSRDAQWVIGVVLAAAMALSVQIAGIRTDVRRLEDRLNAMDDRLRAVEIAFAKVDQRLATLERLHLPAPDPAD